MGLRASFVLCFFLRLILSTIHHRPPETCPVTVDTTCNLRSWSLDGYAPFCFAPRRRCPLAPLPFAHAGVWRTSFLLMLSCCGDVELNPGPPSLDSCSVCSRAVKDDQDGLFCEVCLKWNHRICVKMSEAEYYHWSSIDDGWVCPKCEKEALPFHDVSNLSECSIWSHGNRFLSMSESTPPDSRHTRILSLNARSLLPKIDDLRGSVYLPPLCSHGCD